MINTSDTKPSYTRYTKVDIPHACKESKWSMACCVTVVIDYHRNLIYKRPLKQWMTIKRESTTGHIKTNWFTPQNTRSLLIIFISLSRKKICRIIKWKLFLWIKTNLWHSMNLILLCPVYYLYVCEMLCLHNAWSTYTKRLCVS